MAIAPVVIEFLATGMPDIQRAFKNVSDTIAKNESAGVKSTERASKQRANAVDQEARDKVRAMVRADVAIRRAISQGAKEAERASQATARAAERSAQAQTRSAEQSARARIRAEMSAEREIRRIKEQASRDAARFVAKHEATEARAARRQERADLVQRTDRARVITAIGGAGAQGVRVGASRVAAMATQTAGLVTQLGGGFDLGGSVQRTVANRGVAADIANSGFMPNGDNPANRVQRSSSDIMSAAQATAIHAGISTEESLGGLQAFVGKSGDLTTGLETMRQLAELSRATGSSFKDVADAAGDLMSQLGGMDNKGAAVMSIMRGIAGQGKLGAVEMRNLASQMAKLTAAAGQFGGNAVDNILKMGMLAQEARAGGGAASATMAATSVSGFVNTLKTPARIAAFKAQGIDVFDKDKMLRDPTEIIQQSLAKTGGDPEKMKAMFANIMGERAVTSYSNAYRKAEAVKKGSGAGVVQGMFDRQLKGSTMSKADVATAFSRRMSEVDAQMASSREKFDEAVSTKIIPKLLEMLPALEKIVPQMIDLAAQGLPAFVELIKTVADLASAHKGLIANIAAHPIGSILAYEVTKSVGAAGLGEIIKRILMGGGGGAGGGVLGNVVGGAGKLVGGYGGVAAGGVAAGLAVGAVVGNAMLGYSGGTEEAQNYAAKLKAYQATGGAEGMSPKQVQAKLAEAQGRLSDKGGVIRQTGNILTSLVSDSSDTEYKQYKADQGLTDDADLKKALSDVVRALGENTSATRQNSKATPGSNTGPNGAAIETPIAQRK